MASIAVGSECCAQGRVGPRLLWLLAVASLKVFGAANVRGFGAANVRCFRAANVRCFRAANVSERYLVPETISLRRKIGVAAQNVKGLGATVDVQRRCVNKRLFAI